MKRRLPNLLTALSLLTCAAVMALWLRSYSRADYLMLADDAPYVSVARGDLRIAFRGGYLDNGDHVFSMPVEFAGEISSLQSVHIPLWVICSTAAVTCITSYRLGKVAYMRAPGFCPRCRYDLRATPERCPECGTTRTPG